MSDPTFKHPAAPTGHLELAIERLGKLLDESLVEEHVRFEVYAALCSLRKLQEEREKRSLDSTEGVDSYFGWR